MTPINEFPVALAPDREPPFQGGFRVSGLQFSINRRGKSLARAIWQRASRR
jgi:hypothetical protein